MTNLTQALKDRMAAKQLELRARLTELKAFTRSEVDVVVVGVKRKLARLDAYIAKTKAERP